MITVIAIRINGSQGKGGGQVNHSLSLEIKNEMKDKKDVSQNIQQENDQNISSSNANIVYKYFLKL